MNFQTVGAVAKFKRSGSSEVRRRSSTYYADYNAANINDALARKGFFTVFRNYFYLKWTFSKCRLDRIFKKEMKVLGAISKFKKGNKREPEKKERTPSLMPSAVPKRFSQIAKQVWKTICMTFYRDFIRI